MENNSTRIATSRVNRHMLLASALAFAGSLGASMRSGALFQRHEVDVFPSGKSRPKNYAAGTKIVNLGARTAVSTLTGPFKRTERRKFEKNAKQQMRYEGMLAARPKNRTHGKGGVLATYVRNNGMRVDYRP